MKIKTLAEAGGIDMFDSILWTQIIFFVSFFASMWSFLWFVVKFVDAVLYKKHAIFNGLSYFLCLSTAIWFSILVWK